MDKVVLITGSTDGIGLLTSQKLVAQGHRVLIHGRNHEKLKAVKEKLETLGGAGVESFQADLSNFSDVDRLAKEISAKHSHIDLIINNAGIYKTKSPITKDNLDVRFVVNTFAPYFLTKRLLPLMDGEGRVINLSSAAQESVNLDVMVGKYHTQDQFSAYAQSKLAITMWSFSMAAALGDNGPGIIAVNPGSLLASKMVKEGFGVEGKDIGIGADILIRTGLSDEFLHCSGQYFDNDIGELSTPHPDCLDEKKCQALVLAIDERLRQLGVSYQ